jgi:hypothetical protein
MLVVRSRTCFPEKQILRAKTHGQQQHQAVLSMTQAGGLRKAPSLFCRSLTPRIMKDWVADTTLMRLRAAVNSACDAASCTVCRIQILILQSHLRRQQPRRLSQLRKEHKVFQCI